MTDSEVQDEEVKIVTNKTKPKSKARVEWGKKLSKMSAQKRLEKRVDKSVEVDKKQAMSISNNTMIAGLGVLIAAIGVGFTAKTYYGSKSVSNPEQVIEKKSSYLLEM